MRRPAIVVALVLATTSGISSGACGGGGAAASIGASSSASTSSSGAADAGRDGSGGAGAGAAVGVCASCDEVCVDEANDPRNCGGCGHTCAAQTLCDRGTCGLPACLVIEPQCPVDHTCCGDACCPPYEMCCNVRVGDGGVAQACVAIEAGACPTSCAACP